MKVDTSKLKKGSSELTPECRQLIDQISKCRSHAEMLQFLDSINVWIYGKCELYHWIEILDRFDKILEEAARQVNSNEFILHCDTTFSSEDIRLLLLVLNFTTLLIEHSFSRHLYNSIEHLTQLLSSQNMDIVLAVLNLLYMFSKRSNFIPRLSFEKKETLLIKLFNIAERWGDPNYGLALIDCCIRKPKLEFLYQFFIEYMDEKGQAVLLEIPDMMDICNSSPHSEVVKIICEQLSNPSDAVKMRIAHRVRLVSGFKDYKMRLQFVQARLQAVSVLIYSNALQENIDKVLYPGFGEELCELIEKEDVYLVEIRAAVLRTLTSMLHFDRNPNVPRPGSRLSKIIQYTGAERQGGILPLLVRDCIASLTGDGPSEKYPLILATSLFSLLYHLASYEAGGHALIKSGMMQSLLRVISWPGVDLEHITFVTRAVRVIDLITNIDIAKFHQNNGLNVFIDRLENEIKSCREAINDVDSQKESEQNRRHATSNRGESSEANQAGDLMSDDAFSIGVETESRSDRDAILHQESIENFENVAEIHNFEHNSDTINLENESSHMSTAEQHDTPQYPVNSYYSLPLNERNTECASSLINQNLKKLACVTQRAALLKSMLNFLKKSIQDHAHFNGMRNIMETSLPCSLRHIISNAEYYGPSLFLLATDVVTVYVFNEPSLLSSLQDSGITNVMLQSLLQKDVPATREVLGSLPNVFSAMCLNERGLMEFMSYEPFDKLLKVLLSPDYLVAMRRRRSSDPLGDTATNLGNAMDDLMKHHPYLRTDATEAIVRLLNELVRLGSDPNFICWRANKDNNSSAGSNTNDSNVNRAAHSNNTSNQNLVNTNTATETGINENDNDSSGEEDDDDDEMSSASQQQQQHRQNRSSVAVQQMQARTSQQEREAIPLIDYILNVMKFIEAIFSNSSNGEHCREFVLHGGLKPLLQLLSLPNLPVDSPISTTAQAVANVCKSILNLAHETNVIDIALQQLSQIVEKLKPLIKHFNFPGGSVLLHELLTCPKLDDGFSIADYTPLLHSMSSVHGYVVMLVHLCRNASNEMRSVLLKRWGSNCESGLQLLQNLVQLYISLVWESTILLSLCSEEPYAQNSDFSWDDIIPAPSTAHETTTGKSDREGDSTRKFEKGSSSKIKIKPEEQLRYIKSLLAASSRLGRALAELFGTLVKLSVGTPQSRQRRNNEYVTSISSSKFPNADAKEIARVLSSILVNGFCHENINPKPASKLKLTFLICSVGFTGPMLFDDKRSSFHLMISQFCEENGIKAFFDMFYWALLLDGSQSKFSFESCMKMESVLEDSDGDECDFPEGTGEFLDAWLQLLEKMVNPRAILDSPYAISPRMHLIQETVHFEPVFYLVQMHQLALQTIRRIWKRKPIANYGVSMTETIMAVLKHLIRSHTMLSERYQARFNEIQNASKIMEQSTKPSRQPDAANVNADHLKMLTDMGFSRPNVLEALRNTRSLEQATDYLLNHPEATTSALQTGESSTSVLVTDFSSNVMEIDVDPSISSTTPLILDAETPSTSPNKTVASNEIKLITNDLFNKFCEETLERTFEFMEYLPETVNTGAELISVLYRRLTQLEKPAFVLDLVKNISSWTEFILNNMRENDILKSSKFEEQLSGPTAVKLLIRLKVSTLLLDEMFSDIRKEFCVAILQEQCLKSLIMLLNTCEALLQEQVLKGIKPATPRWLQSLIEFIDAIDNVSIILQRKENMRAVCSDNWRWYDASTGKWNSYSEANNLLLKNAFNMGERSVVINNGRQRYTVNFNCMTQVSEASGSHRPVLPALKITDAIASYSNSNFNATKVDSIITQTVKTSNDGKGVMQQEEKLCLRSLLNFSDDENNRQDVVEEEDKDINVEQQEASSATNPFPYSGSGVPPLATSSAKKTKSKGSAMTNTKKPMITFPEYTQNVLLNEEAVGLSKYDTSEIISCLVRMLQPTLTIKFETKLSILKLCARLTKDYVNAKAFIKNGGIKLLLGMQQSCGLMGFPTYAIVIIRHVLESPIVLQESIERILTTRTSQSVPIGHRDLIFVLTQVSSAVARHPGIFLAAAKQAIRADYITSPTFAIDDSRLLVKAQAAVNRKCSNITYSSPKSEEDTSSIQTSEEVIQELLRAIVQPCVHYGGCAVNDDEYEYKQEMQEVQPLLSESPSTSTTPSKKVTEKFEPCCCSWHIPSSGHVHSKPILPRSTLLKILADAVRSYQLLVPRIIVEHKYTSADSILIKSEQSCLSFILDNFLPITTRQQDCEVSMMSRVLISSLSDCFGQSSIQTKVVEEIHDAIVRTLAQPDSAEKYTRLQVFIGLIPILIESPMLSNKVHLQRNNMYRILLRQGIMTDLSKIAQYNDLSNSNALATIYSILRPMEILLRLTVAPGTLSSKRIFFGTAPQNSSSFINRRFYPRLTSRTSPSTVSNSIGGEHVLRDIIRNVLSDRRHAFDFIFNADDIFLDSEDAAPATATSGDDDADDNERDANAPTTSSSSRPQLNFDRLWDDLLQNEGLRLVNRNTNTSNTVHNSVVAVGDHHRHHSNDEAGNNDNGVGGGSDGASTSSETAPAAADNSASLLGDVSTSESDSDSNVSTENERNDEDEDDDEDDDVNEEGVEDRSETDADEETRQFIEVFDHIYEPESSETASNDADADADDEASEVGGGPNPSAGADPAGGERSSETHMPNEEEQHESNPSGTSTHAMTNEVNIASHSQSANDGNDVPTNALRSSVRITPASAWVAPRIGFIGNDSHTNYTASIDLSAPNNTTVAISSERNENVAISGTPTVFMNSIASNSLPVGSSAQRREPTRRLVFLDQQYCAAMPTFSNPIEDGQIELFNQDALHWWLEEAKHLDLESQTDACLYVAHLLIPFLIKELKASHSQKKFESTNATANNSSSANRRSAIPVLIQQSINSTSSVPNQSTAVSTATSTNTQPLEAILSASNSQESSQFRVPQALRAPRSTSLSQRFEQHQLNVHRNLLEEADCPSEDEHPVVSDANEGEVDDDEEDDFEDDEDLDDEDDDELNTTFMEEDELNSTFNIDFDNETANALTQSNAEDSLNIPQEESLEIPHNDENVESPPVQQPEDMAESTTIPVVDIAEQERPAEMTSMDLGAAAMPAEPTLTASTSQNDADVASSSTQISRVTPVMNPEVRAALGDLEVPEGVDPSFLAALPSEMREEVINEHLRMQRIRQRAQQNAIQVAHDSLLEVNPEFLAALPPNIQSEVLMQQRIEQQRQAAQSANPEDPVDTAAFFQNLPESLRQAILTDMEESQIASLPPDLAAEAQYLRRDWESRNGARLEGAHSNALNGYLTARFPSSLQNINDDSRWHTNSIWYDANGTPQSQHHQHTTIVHQHQQQLHGKPIALLLMEDEHNLLDPDSLTTLLLFVFIEDSKMNCTRFHRVIRNLCYHVSTREWIISALMSIIQKTNEGKIISGRKCIKPQWLKLRVDAAFGFKSNIFIINKSKETSGNSASSGDYSITINPQAAQMVVRNCLDMLFVLAKHFPRSFIPYNREHKNRTKLTETNISSNTASETIGNIPISVAINAGASGADTEMSSEELRAIFQRHHSSDINLNSRRLAPQSRPAESKGIEFKLDDSPSTSKAAAVRNHHKSNVSPNKSKLFQGLQYNTNANQFWDVLLNIDVHSQHRLTNVHSFPVNSHPTWEWTVATPNFQSFHESPFARLLEMLPFKVICRSPQLTDMLVKLLAYLSSELPKENETVEQSTPDTNPSFVGNPDGAATQSTDASNEASLKQPESKDADSSSDEEEKQLVTPIKCKRKLYSKNFFQLQLVIEVLTHQCGTTDGLDNISKLIVNLSQCSQASNAIFLQYLTAAILGLAQEVRQAIQNLLEEIHNYNRVSKEQPATVSNPSTLSNIACLHQGIMQDRFTAENVVISAPTVIKPSCELQLPAMKKLLLSSSAQPYFLRTLKIFMEVRELFEAQDNGSTSNTTTKKATLSQIICLDDLWSTLSECLVALEESKDEYAVLVLQPTVEAFFLIHASYKKNTNKPDQSSGAPGQSSRTGNRNNVANEESNQDTVPVVTPIDPETNSIQTQEQKSEEPSDSDPSTSIPQSTNTEYEMQVKLDRQKFLSFAEKHRTVLNQILRQSPIHLSDGPFAVLVDHTRILDFDVKRKYFQTELERIDEGVRREENTVSVRRVTVFEDSFRVLYRLGPEEWKNRFYIVFEDEEGQDAGGLLREWYVIISREIFNPMYALFCVSPGDRVTYMINTSSHANPNHLSYFKFVGRVIAKAIHDNKLLECYFTRSFYKHILGKLVKYTDMESQDYEFYKGLDYLMKNNISTLGYELTFSTEVQEFGVTQVRDLIPNGRDITVTEENKFDYVQLVCQLKMSGSIRQQLDAFLEGFYDIIPKHLISIFNEQELELLISGLPDIDIEDLKANTEYHKYTSKSMQILWFWRALRSFDQADRAKFLQFVTGTSKVPLQGFGSLEGMNGIQKFQIHRDDRSTDRLPCAHTCFNQLDLPMYKSYEKLRTCLLKAIHECSEGFGFA